ncbi:MAG: ABC transporter ATP-binding protein [Myxococcota bacterium]
MDPALRCEQVVKRFGDFVAVDHVDLTVRPGEIFALLGPNGAGKTTLIHCVTGLARQTSGTIEVFGTDARKDFRKTRKLVGLVPQEINFDPFFTPIESLEIQMGLMGVQPDRAYCEQLLSTFRLTSHRHAYTRHLSGGMKRRLLVAKALVHRPKLLFLDEPTAGVDVELRKELWTEVLRLRDQGTTIILTTHYLEEAEQLADRIGVIHRGHIVVTDDRDALMRRHRRQSLHVTLAAPIERMPEGLPDDAELIEGRTLIVPWRYPEDLENALARIRRSAGILDITVEQNRLEDIFIDLIASADKTSTDPASAERLEHEGPT